MLQLKLTVAACIAATAAACNTVEELAADLAAGGSLSHGGLGGLDRELSGTAPLTLLPQDKGNESPACLDGSPYGFYFNPSKTGSTKWTISIEGGGWCYDEQECYSRSKMALGSSKGWSKTAGCGCMNTKDDGLDEDCNCLYMP
jgi:hypothetical protein